MIKRLLVPLDGSELSERALVMAGDLAESLNATMILARVVPPPVAGRSYAPHLLEQLQEAHTKEAQQYVDAIARRARNDRLTVETRVPAGDVATTLIRLAQQEDCDLIVMGSHGMGGLGWHVFGSVAQKVLHGSTVPVLVVRSTREEYEREEEKEEALSDEALLGELSGPEGGEGK